MTDTKPKRRKDTYISKTFGAQIRALRIKKGWSQEELAHEAKLHVTYLSGLERGRRNPTLSLVTDLARAFRLPPWKLLKNIKPE